MWWNERERKEQWVEVFEVKLADESEELMPIGFIGHKIRRMG